MVFVHVAAPTVHTSNISLLQVYFRTSCFHDFGGDPNQFTSFDWSTRTVVLFFCEQGKSIEKNMIKMCKREKYIYLHIYLVIYIYQCVLVTQRVSEVKGNEKYSTWYSILSHGSTAPPYGTRSQSPTSFDHVAFGGQVPVV